MLSIVVCVRNTQRLFLRCLESLLNTLTVLGSAEEVEVILIDDRSDAEAGIPPLFERVREQGSSPTRLLLLTERQYYTYACSLGLSVAKGEFVLFLSHDMVVAPAYVRALLGAAAVDEAFGIIRGTSPHVDCMPQHVIAPPLRCRNYRDVCAFAEYVAAYHGDEIVEDRFLVGDSFLVKRSVIEKIGVMDLRYQHLFGDLDFGVRAPGPGSSSSAPEAPGCSTTGPATPRAAPPPASHSMSWPKRLAPWSVSITPRFGTDGEHFFP